MTDKPAQPHLLLQWIPGLHQYFCISSGSSDLMHRNLTDWLLLLMQHLRVFCNPPSITGTSGKLGHWVDSKYISNVFSPECKAMKFQSILIGMRWIFSIESWQLGWYRCNQYCITSINCPLSQNNTEVSQWSRVTKDILPAIYLFITSLLIDASLPINENTFQNWSKSPEWLISEANDCKCHRRATEVEQSGSYGATVF